MATKTIKVCDVCKKESTAMSSAFGVDVCERCLGGCSCSGAGDVMAAFEAAEKARAQADMRTMSDMVHRERQTIRGEVAMSFCPACRTAVRVGDVHSCFGVGT